MAKKEPKQKTPEQIKAQDDKKFSVWVNHVFLRPFARRLTYIYTGIVTHPNVFALGNYDDDTYRYAEPKQSIGVVRFKKDEDYQRAIQWLSSFGINFDIVGYIYLDRITQALGKVKWDHTQITTRTDPLTGRVHLKFNDPNVFLPVIQKVIKEKTNPIPGQGQSFNPAQQQSSGETDDDDEKDDDDKTEVVLRNDVEIFAPVSSILFYESIGWKTDHYVTSILDGQVASFSYDRFDASRDNLIPIKLSEEEITQQDPSFTGVGNIRTVMIRGLDFLTTKFLDEVYEKEQQPLGTSRVVFWRSGGNALDYGHVYTSHEYEYFICRCNTMLIGRG